MRVSSAPLSYEALKTKQQATKDLMPQNLALRVHRALSWLARAEQEMAAEDYDAAFVFFWISFNSAYGEQRPWGTSSKEAEAHREYFGRIFLIDPQGSVYDAIWERVREEIAGLLRNPYVYRPFWNHQLGLQGSEDWQRQFEQDAERISRAFKRRDTVSILTTLFQRLYVLRNQLMHGGATWKGGVNRRQVSDGARIMAFLVPRFVELMMDHPKVPWGNNQYPVVDARSADNSG